MNGFYFGNGNGYSYVIRDSDGHILEFVSDSEAFEYFDNHEEDETDM